MSLTGHCGAAVGAAHCASLSEMSRFSSRPRCAVSGPRTSTTGASDIRMPPPWYRAPPRLAPRQARYDQLRRPVFRPQDTVQSERYSSGRTLTAANIA